MEAQQMQPLLEEVHHCGGGGGFRSHSLVPLPDHAYGCGLDLRSQFLVQQP